VFELFVLVIKCVVVLQLSLGLASFCTWFERKGSALIQDRVGANRAGSFFYTDRWYLKPFMPVIRMLGILGVINTLFCDSVKGIMKEDFVPEGSSRFLHGLAPVLAVLPVVLAFAVLPLAPRFELGGYVITPQVASIDAGLLFVLAMGSVAVYGVALAGWTGNNKFSMLGALRASAQMISYELAMGLAMVSIVVCYGTLDVYGMVEQQSKYIFGVLPAWGIVLQPVGFIVLLIVGMAETKRGPFDLPEAESELTAGYFTEYSGMKFLMFWLGEFAEIALFAVVLALLFAGGWQIPYLNLADTPTWWAALIGHAVLMAKIVFFCMLQIVIRWTLPRFRYDQLMNLGWKILLPVSLVNLLVTAAVVVAL
jgi:NADH-quinone oxidoreductase subunit H